MLVRPARRGDRGEREGWILDGGRREEEFLGVPVTEVRYRTTFD